MSKQTSKSVRTYPLNPEQRKREHVAKMLLRAQRKAQRATRNVARWQAVLDSMNRAEVSRQQLPFWPEDTTAPL